MKLMMTFIRSSKIVSLNIFKNIRIFSRISAKTLITQSKKVPRPAERKHSFRAALKLKDRQLYSDALLHSSLSITIISIVIVISLIVIVNTVIIMGIINIVNTMISPTCRPQDWRHWRRRCR